jgi:5-methylcytosine-specific restriction endonuclease McrA
MKTITFRIDLPRFAVVLLFLVFVVCCADAQRSRSHTSYSGKHRSTYSTTAPRDSHGRIKRSSKAKEVFMKRTGYPKGRRGYVVDHIVPLSKGGADSPSNMQWQTKADAKAKDKWERGQKSSAKKYRSERK